jgi:transposase-like protein
MKKMATQPTKGHPKGISYAKKKQITDAVENGQISLSQAARLHGVSRSSIQRWLKKIGNYEKKLLQMGGKSAQQKIRELEKRIKELEAREVIYETAFDIVEKDYGVSKKKFLPGTFQDFLKETKKK